MGALSKHKGNAFESTVAKILTKWYGEEFKRVPASGALRWNNRIWTFGDILPPVGLPLVVECKHHAAVSVDDLLGNRKLDMIASQIGAWWLEQALPDAQRACEELGVASPPLLVWRQNRGRIRCMMWHEMFRCRKNWVDHLLVPLTEGVAVLCDFEKFLASVEPQVFKDFCSVNPCE